MVLLFTACGHGIPVMTCYSTSRATESRPGRGTGLRLSGPAASPVWSKSQTLIQAVKLCPATVPWKPSRCMLWRRVRVRRQRWRIPGSIATPQSLVKVSRTTLHTNTEKKSNTTMYSQTSGTRQNALTHSQTLKRSQTQQCTHKHLGLDRMPLHTLKHWKQVKHNNVLTNIWDSTECPYTLSNTENKSNTTRWHWHWKQWCTTIH